MELATNRVAIYSIALGREHLYNAAQGGIEWGKAQLWKNRASISDEQKIYGGNLRDLAATKSSGEEIAFGQEVQVQSPGITVEVTILDCNYNPNSALYSEDLPPVIPISGYVSTSPVAPDDAFVVNSSDESAPPGSSLEEEHVFLIRSKAIDEDKKELTIESVVAIRFGESIEMSVLYWQVKN